MEYIILNFNYKGQETIMQIQRNENIKDIFRRYSNRMNKDINNIYFLNNGNKLNSNLELEKINHKFNKINIFVFDICKKNNNNNEGSSIPKQDWLPSETPNGEEEEIEKEKEKEKEEEEFKDIICPKCGENCLIEIKDYKINLKKCDNKHDLNNILLDEYNNIQIINEIKIKNNKCNICNKNKSEINDNNMYKCCTCNINLCPLCKSYHNKDHIIIDYDLINYVCKVHGERYTSYCKECEKNICDICELEHDNNHNLIYHRDIIKNKENNNINELKIKIDKLKSEIKDIINKLNKIIKDLDIYYNINNIINNNNNIRNRNYQILININNIYKSNDIIINDINNIINESSINSKIEYLYEMYNKMIDNRNITKKYEFGQYNGELRNDKREGKGQMHYNNGNIYEGEWKNDKIEGKGIYYFNNCDRYEGDFKAGKREGKGIMFYNDCDKYEGDWKNDKREGRGIMYYNNGNRYEGEWKSGNREGKGIYYYNDGDSYEGDFKNDKREGKGIYYYNNGNRYEGDWKDDKREGKGIFYFNNGSREMGDYLKGKKIGKHATLDMNGRIKSNNY